MRAFNNWQTNWPKTYRFIQVLVLIGVTATLTYLVNWGIEAARAIGDESPLDQEIIQALRNQTDLLQTNVIDQNKYLHNIEKILERSTPKQREEVERTLDSLPVISSDKFAQFNQTMREVELRYDDRESNVLSGRSNAELLAYGLLFLAVIMILIMIGHKIHKACKRARQRRRREPGGIEMTEAK